MAEQNERQPHWKDWPGLLKWSLQYQDGTEESSKEGGLKEMDPERRKWLAEALSSVKGEVDVMVENFKIVVQSPEKYFEKSLTEEELAERTNALTQVRDIVDNLDNAKDLISIRAFEPLIDLLGSKYSEIQCLAAETIGIAVQNHPVCQAHATEKGAVAQLMKTYRETSCMKVKVACFGALSSLVRGNSPGFGPFLSDGGIALCMETLEHWKDNSARLNHKCLFLLGSLSRDSPQTLSQMNEGISKLLIEIIEKNEENWNLREAALHLISQMCSGDKVWVSRFKEAGLLPLLLKLRKEVSSLPMEEQDSLFDVVDSLNSVSRILMK
eukprot:CAMPEP_0201475268 /NCGR_PEP_ID=MMETSP0151_2-20130828/716_1 /ASSEMBLY_ACC=CAM_ASM_000257 /TAXON_ID=200890 /ORGANISM="Paramoeba atlantica, Strain 621/1 / CCAP 1560/9" /LENGTH=325 /DNA_ID=CAMNT_0047855313 /DNA_START=75 /DNA_END=1052 /DNA_ORIENTATION=-